MESVLEKLKIGEIVLKCGTKTGREGPEGEWRGPRWRGGGVVNAAPRPFYPGKETPVPMV